MARIHRCRQLRQQHPELDGAQPDAVAAYLHANNMIIVCDHDAWVIESDTAKIPLVPGTGFPLTTAKIPGQRHGDQQKRDGVSRFVWN